MPAKNSLKVYVENSYYHIYNRGVEKRSIFQDDQDYAVFLSYIKTYLLPKDEKGLGEQLLNPNIGSKERYQILKQLKLNNFSDEITLLSYCLMSNHFHFLIKQKSANSIDKFMNSLSTRYTMYFNKKNKRVGPLYQDVYKAVLVESDDQLLYLTKYIHRNPLKRKLASTGDALQARLISQPSSYPEYLGNRQTKWIYPEEILSFFSKTNPRLSYRNFVEEEGDIEVIKDKAIDL